MPAKPQKRMINQLTNELMNLKDTLTDTGANDNELAEANDMLGKLAGLVKHMRKELLKCEEVEKKNTVLFDDLEVEINNLRRENLFLKKQSMSKEQVREVYDNADEVDDKDYKECVDYANKRDNHMRSRFGIGTREKIEKKIMDQRLKDPKMIKRIKEYQNN
jgi:hypothetical protein